MYLSDTSRIPKNFDTARMLGGMEWYDRAKGRMADKGLTQADLEQALGVSRGAVSHYLTGKRDPSPDQLVSLARKLELSLDSLLLGSDTPAVTSQPERPDYEKISSAVTVLREYVEITGSSPELITDSIALQIAYEVVDEYGEPVSAENVLSLTKILGKKIRGESDGEQGPLRTTRAAAGGKGR